MMKETSLCPECGGQREWFDCGMYMAVQASQFSGSFLQALVCLSCGSTSLYVSNLDKLQQAAEKRRKQRG